MFECWHMLEFYCQAAFWLHIFLFRGLQHAPSVSHYRCENPPFAIFFFSLKPPLPPPLFTRPCIRGNLIFHISFWFAHVIVREAGSHATDRPGPLIRPTTTNCKWRTNERIIDRFHGNWQDGLSFPIPVYKWPAGPYWQRQWTFQHGVKCTCL